MIVDTEGRDIAATGAIPVREDGTYEAEDDVEKVAIIGRIVNGICDGAYRVDGESIILRMRFPPTTHSMTMRDFVDQLDRAADPEKVLGFSRFTPVVFSELRHQVWFWCMPIAAALLSRQTAKDIFEVEEWERWYSPMHLHEVVARGHLGRLVEMELYVDFSPDPVLDDGEAYLFAHPQYLWTGDGAINPKGVAKGVRLT